MEGREPRAVVLWGLGDIADRYRGCLEDAGVRIAACVDAAHAGTTFGGVEVISPLECARQSYRYAALPVVVTGSGGEARGAAAFDDDVRVIVNELDLPVRVLHPAFLADHVGLDHRGWVFLTGFPGAGNETVRRVVSELLGERPVRLDGKTALLAQLAGEYHEHTLTRMLERLFDLGGRHESRLSTVAGDEACLEVQLSHERLAVLRGLRSKAALFAPLHATHERPSEAAVERARRSGRAVLVLVRHPVELIVRAAARMAYPPTPVLDDLEWFRAMAVVVRDYHDDALRQQHRVGLIRYERLLEAPAATVQAVAHAIGIEASRAQAEAIWERTGFVAPAAATVGARNLQRWAATRRCWQEELGPAHAGMLRELGYPALLAALGYDAALEVSDPARPEASPRNDAGGRGRLEAAYLDFLHHVLYGKPVQLRHEHGHCHRDPLVDVELFANDPHLWSLVKVALSSRYFRTLLTALGP
jgi:hypothetical protein